LKNLFFRKKQETWTPKFSEKTRNSEKQETLKQEFFKKNKKH